MGFVRNGHQTETTTDREQVQECGHSASALGSKATEVESSALEQNAGGSALAVPHPFALGPTVCAYSEGHEIFGASDLFTAHVTIHKVHWLGARKESQQKIGVIFKRILRASIPIGQLDLLDRDTVKEAAAEKVPQGGLQSQALRVSARVGARAAWLQSSKRKKRTELAPPAERGMTSFMLERTLSVKMGKIEQKTNKRK